MLDAISARAPVFLRIPGMECGSISATTRAAGGTSSSTSSRSGVEAGAVWTVGVDSAGVVDTSSSSTPPSLDRRSRSRDCWSLVAVSIRSDGGRESFFLPDSRPKVRVHRLVSWAGMSSSSSRGRSEDFRAGSSVLVSTGWLLFSSLACLRRSRAHSWVDAAA